MEGHEEPSANASAGELGRLRYVDALRGIAVLLVLWLHVSSSFRGFAGGGGRWLETFASTIDVGRIGVVIFFLISGFLIPFSMRPGSAGPIGAFAIRRVFRIYPAYWLSVPLAAWVFFWGVGAPFPPHALAANFTLLQTLFGIPHAEGVYWTLVVEIAFYALCVVLLLTRSLFDPRRIAVLALVLALTHVFAMLMLWLGRPVLGVEAAFWPLNLSVMLWGSLYRFATGRDADRVASAILRLLGVLFVVALPLGAAWAVREPVVYTIAYSLAFLVFIAGTRFFRIETRLTDWLGRISYSVYLFHPIVFQPVFLWLVREPVDSPWRTQHLAVYIAANLVLTLGVASLVYRFVERPAIRFGHRLAAAYEQRASHSRVASPAHQCAAPAATLPNGGFASQTIGIIRTNNPA